MVWTTDNRRKLVRGRRNAASDPHSNLNIGQRERPAKLEERAAAGRALLSQAKPRCSPGRVARAGDFQGNAVLGLTASAAWRRGIQGDGRAAFRSITKLPCCVAGSVHSQFVFTGLSGTPALRRPSMMRAHSALKVGSSCASMYFRTPCMKFGSRSPNFTAISLASLS